MNFKNMLKIENPFAPVNPKKKKDLKKMTTKSKGTTPKVNQDVQEIMINASLKIDNSMMGNGSPEQEALFWP